MRCSVSIVLIFLPSTKQSQTTTEAFAWSSDTDDFIGDTVSFTLNSYAFLTALEMQFPAGDTYKFDIVCYDADETPFTYFTVSFFFFFFVLGTTRRDNFVFVILLS